MGDLQGELDERATKEAKKKGAPQPLTLSALPSSLPPTPLNHQTQGTLAKLDTDSPVLYVDFPCGGRLKFEGSLVFPRAKYAVMRVGAREILCEDVIENMVCFSKAIWVGTAAENPTEKEMPMPEGVLTGGANASEGGKASSKANKKGVTEEWFGDCVGLGAPLGGGLGVLPAAAGSSQQQQVPSSAPQTDDEGAGAGGDSQRGAGGRMRCVFWCFFPPDRERQREKEKLSLYSPPPSSLSLSLKTLVQEGRRGQKSRLRRRGRLGPRLRPRQRRRRRPKRLSGTEQRLVRRAGGQAASRPRGRAASPWALAARPRGVSVAGAACPAEEVEGGRRRGGGRSHGGERR